jgi:VWFA-related protein
MGALLFCLCLCVKAPPASQAAENAAAPRLVEVNVIVHNEQGTAAGLTRDDFRIFDRGQPRSIASFEAHSPGEVRQPAAQLPPLVYVNQAERDAGPAGATAILLDGLNTHIEDGAAARRQLLKFLGQIKPSDRVGIYLMGSRLRVMQPYTSDSQNLAGPLAAGAVGDPNIAGVEEMAAVFSGSDPELHGYGPAERMTRTSEQLVQLARHIGRVPGRKSLIWLSGGIPLTPWDADPKSLSAEMARVARALSDSGIAIYPVDAGALFTPNKRRAGVETLDRLAALTGGRPFTAPDDLLQVVHAVLAESAVSYTVGFAADAAGSALEFRDLRIETARPGLQLVYPRGYLTGPVPQPAAGREQEIASVLTSPVESKEISLSIELKETTAEGKPALNLRGRILGSDITQQPDGAGFAIAVDISCQQISSEGRNLGSLDFPIAATLNAAQAQQLRKTGGTWNKMVRPSSQATQLRIAAYDRNSGRAGSIFVPLPSHTDTDRPALTFRTDTNLALVHFQVSPKKGEFVTDLRSEEIVVKEDGVAQKIAVFEGGRFYPRTMPVEISLLFDCSGSMAMAGLINPHVFGPNLLDEYENVRIAIYGFSDDLTRLTTPTRDPETLQTAMAGVLRVPHGNTPLFRTIGALTREAAGTPGDAIRMVVIFSDGESYPLDDSNLCNKAVSDAQELGVALYPVTLKGVPSQSGPMPIGPPPSSPNPMPTYGAALDRELSTNLFAGLGRLTGGQAFASAPSTEVLPNILRSLGREIRYEYVVGYYYPAGSGSGKRRRVTVSWSGKGRGEIMGGTRMIVY